MDNTPEEKETSINWLKMGAHLSLSRNIRKTQNDLDREISILKNQMTWLMNSQNEINNPTRIRNEEERMKDKILNVKAIITLEQKLLDKYNVLAGFLNVEDRRDNINDLIPYARRANQRAEAEGELSL